MAPNDIFQIFFYTYRKLLDFTQTSAVVTELNFRLFINEIKIPAIKKNPLINNLRIGLVLTVPAYVKSGIRYARDKNSSTHTCVIRFTLENSH